MTMGYDADDGRRRTAHVAPVRRDAAAVQGGGQSRSTSRR
jgi:hypothetical protein